ncbi:MAG: hypothetical protein E6J85_04085 [Deltaproteobacteria bacterium]|nr:MAG: hypothetical protein E6J85_04085 [Deltaproteobacteria bacterium]
MNRRAALAAAIPIAFSARAAGPGTSKASGTYEVVHLCDRGQPCPPAEQRHFTLVLLDEPAPDQAAPGIAVCSRHDEFAWRGCFWKDAEREGTLREVAWSKKGSRIRVGLECGPDYGQDLLFRTGATTATWKARFCCVRQRNGKEMLAHVDATVTLKRVGAADPQRCRR